jgi:aldose 1-epimerase
MLRIEKFGEMPDGREISRYLLTNTNGMEVAITNYAAAITHLKVPDHRGHLADVVLGFDSLDGYLDDKVFMGAVVGRYANRIGKARFSLDGKEYQLVANNKQNTLHGGSNGFFKKVWDLKANRGNAVTLAYVSADGEEGFPGNLTAEITYSLTETNEVRLAYRATTDKATVVTLTGHAYFNLAGEGTSSILDHELMIDADSFVPTDEESIPTGELRSVKGTPFDFTSLTPIGERIESDDEQMKSGNGYDQCWVLRHKKIGELTRAAFVRDSNSNRGLEVWTTEPGIQFYSGNFLDGTARGKAGHCYPWRSGFCLETQHFPDSPNHPSFPSTVLRPGQEYRSTTIYKFSTT